MRSSGEAGPRTRSWIRRPRRRSATRCPPIRSVSRTARAERSAGLNAGVSEQPAARNHIRHEKPREYRFLMLDLISRAWEVGPRPERCGGGPGKDETPLIRQGSSGA
ncbi:hypothetical protein MIPYR_10740 [uncultured Microbacterium sp.]|uniref:Uncharacterized protein n=1 Tax=uncultured Microbacterium sp. TaxID=191216 RepID=A0A1Y5NWY2_9MICO|nr:hypothetical protein MIPYR_10740 [uncultured Microbacterium sp.]